MSPVPSWRLAASYPIEELHAARQAFIDKLHAGNIVVTLE